jgi:HlyD family secretion protein
MKLKNASIYGIMIILIAALIYGLLAFQRGGETSGAGKRSDSSAPTAYVESDVINASFKTAGRIAELLVEEGDQVKKGQVIARLESKELQDKVKQAEAALQAAKANVAQAKAGVSQAQASVSAAEAKKSQGSEAVKVTSETAASKIAQAQAAADAAKANWEALKAGARPQEIQQAEINMKAAKDAYDLAAKQQERTRELFAAGAASQAALDQANLDKKQAQAKYEAAEKQVELAKAGSREEEIAAAKAQYEQALAAVKEAQAGAGQVVLQQQDVKAAQASVQQAQSAVEQAQSTVTAAESQVAQAEAALEEARTYLSYTELKAPTDGIISSKSLNVGELASAGFTVFSIETTSQRWAKFYVPETELNGLKAGDQVMLKILADNSQFKGKVTVIDAAADFAVQKPSQSSGDTDIRSFGVKVELAGLPASVPTGSTVFLLDKGAQAHE